MKRDFNCGTGSGGFEPGNSCAGGGGGGGGGGNAASGSSGGGGTKATGKGKRDPLALPKNRKVTIPQAVKALAEKGMTLGKSTWNPKTKSTSWEVKDSSGNTRTVNARDLVKELYND